MENAEGRVLVVSYIMKSSKGGEGKNFNLSCFRDCELHLAQASLMSGSFPKPECCANPAARSHKTSLSVGIFKTSLGKVWSYTSHPTALAFL